jgi:DNA-binding transcriptional MerR regulator
MTGGPTMAAETVIPKRQVFKATEVCSIAGVQPYILKSWEAEFPMLARPKRKGGARVYRRTDVEMVLQIKHLVFGEGLTLGAAHRQLNTTMEPAEESAQPGLLTDVLETDVRDRLAGVKQGLQDILLLLSANGETAPAPKAKSGRTAPTLRGKKAPAKRAVGRAAKSVKVKKSAAKSTKTTKTKKSAARKHSA